MSRWKDVRKEGGKGVTEDLYGFMDELQEIFPEVIITSGKREQKKESHHIHGDAVDIHHDPRIYSYLMNTPEGLALMDKYKLGVYDESNPNIMAKTGATGPHFHIGKDSGLYSRTQSRMSTLKKKGSIPRAVSFIEGNPNFDYNPYRENRNWSDYKGVWDSYNSDQNINYDSYDFSSLNYDKRYSGGENPANNPEENIITFTKPTSDETLSASYVNESDFQEEVKDAIERDEEEREMLSSSPEANAINKELENRLAFLQEYEAALNQREKEFSFNDVQGEEDDGGYSFQEIDEINLELPNLPEFSETLLGFTEQNNQ